MIGMDNSIMRDSSVPWPDMASWNKFRNGMMQLKKTGYGDFRLVDDFVIVHSPFSESLFFSRTMDSTFCKLDYRDGYFLRTIAASYLLYDLHCGRGQDGISYSYAGTWEDVQNGVNDLKEAGVFNPNYSYALSYTDVLKDSLDAMRKAARQAVHESLEHALSLPPKSAAKEIRDAAISAVLPLVPENIREMDAIAHICDRDVLGRMNLIRIVIDGDVHWFRDAKEVAGAFPGDPPPFLNMTAFGPDVSKYRGVYQEQEYDVKTVRYRELPSLDDSPHYSTAMRL